LVGALVIELLDRRTVPVLLVDAEDYRRIGDGAPVSISRDGTITVEMQPER
jgi:hypothetical protein